MFRLAPSPVYQEELPFGRLVVASRSSTVYHAPSCNSARRFKASSRVVFKNPGLAEARGYRACSICKPNKAISGVTELSDKEPVQPGTESRFGLDVASLMVARCLQCHHPENPQGGLDLSSYERLMAGSESGAIITLDDPAASPLLAYLRRSASDHANRVEHQLDPETISRIERWITQGAPNDPSSSFDQPLVGLVESSGTLQNATLANRDRSDRLSRIALVALQRWRAIDPEADPPLLVDDHFILFGEISERDGRELLDGLIEARKTLSKLLGRGTDLADKFSLETSVYLFQDVPTFHRFNQSMDTFLSTDDTDPHLELSRFVPYVSAIDPISSASNELNRQSREILLERLKTTLVATWINAALIRSFPEAPRWLSQGLGALMAARYDPYGTWTDTLRAESLQAYRAGWLTRSSEAIDGLLGDQETRAIGFSMLEWLSNTSPRGFGPFIRGMLEGAEHFDAGTLYLFSANRLEFQQSWGIWVAQNYGRNR